MITKYMITEGIRNQVIQFIQDPNMELGTVCQIGDFWFYFGGMTAEELNPSEYLSVVSLDSVIDDVYNALESFREDRTFRDEYDYYESVLMTELIRDIQPGVKLYRDRLNGIVWAEDHRTGLGISIHPNIDETGSVDGMINLGHWRKDDRVAKSHGWIYNIDRLAYDSNDPIEAIVAAECRCAVCLERKKETK